MGESLAILDCHYPIKYIIKKQLSALHCRFIMGIIGPSRELSPIIPELIHAIETEKELGSIEDILPTQNFPDAPESYIREMGSESLSTAMIVLNQMGAYTDLHYLKKGTQKVEEQFLNSANGRIFNINPGAVGTYGLCLASHKPTGGRQDCMPWVFRQNLLFHLFESEAYCERVMRWRADKMMPLEKVAVENRFPEYTEASRVAKFEELVLTLPKSYKSIELLADRL